MAIGWMALLKAVPWGEVARKAPEIAESAKKLWSTVARKPAQTELEVHTAFASEHEDVSWLKQRLATIEAANVDLHNQMLATTELIKALAEQNTQLVKNIELNRIRTIRLAAFSVVIGLIALYCLAKTLIN